MSEHPVSVAADDGSYWRLVDNEWVGWTPGEDGQWTESEAAMELSFPEVVQRWHDLHQPPPDETVLIDTGNFFVQVPKGKP